MAKSKAAAGDRSAAHQPYVSDRTVMPELTWQAVLAGVLLGIVFGASSLYLVLKVALTVSASIPVAVLSITLFRALSRMFGLRPATILENNIVQTTGSAGESIAFGLGVTIPALLLLGHDMDLVRVMTVAVLGGLLGILMMIPLRRAFIVRQHGTLTYPEGTACAEVLIVGEEGGATAKMVFAGFFVAFFHKLMGTALMLWHEVPTWSLASAKGKGLPGGQIGGDLAPELLGVGYIIGPRIASIMLAGGMLANLVLLPAIVLFSSTQSRPVPPATALVSDMSVGQIRTAYILYIGAGAVTTGGVLSMLQALPLIFGSLRAGLRDLAAARAAGAGAGKQLPRTERDLSLWFVLGGSLALIVALTVAPTLGLGFSLHGMVGALLIVLFGFLFVTVSARLTGEIGSSSNPISGMTVATLLFTCLIFLLMGRTDKQAALSALTIAAIVCIASSNAGTTAQDLKTGFLVGATPRLQQIAILIGALTSAVVIGVTLLLLNSAGTIYSRNPAVLPLYRVPDVAQLTSRELAGGQYAGQDSTLYRVLHVGEGEIAGVPQGKYLVDDTGTIRYLVDPAINGRLQQRDDGVRVANKFDAPKTRLMAIVIDGILHQKLPWSLVLIGALIALTLELCGVPSLPFAVGVYVPIQVSVPIFLGGALRWGIDRIKRSTNTEADTSPGVLLASGYIAGGAIGGVLVAFLSFAPDAFPRWLDVGARLPKAWQASQWPAVAAFSVLMVLLWLVGWGKLLGSGAAPPAVPRKEGESS